MSEWVRQGCKPKKVDDVSMAFPANALEYMPPMDKMPPPFRDDHDSHPAMVLVRRLNFGPPIPANVEFHAVEGISAEMAFRQIRMIGGSFAPKHEHKEAAMAYFISIWFTKVIVPSEDGEDEVLWQA